MGNIPIKRYCTIYYSKYIQKGQQAIHSDFLTISYSSNDPLHHTSSCTVYICILVPLTLWWEERLMEMSHIGFMFSGRSWQMHNCNLRTNGSNKNSRNFYHSYKTTNALWQWILSSEMLIRRAKNECSSEENTVDKRI